jgi:hypothetical protein
MLQHEAAVAGEYIWICPMMIARRHLPFSHELEARMCFQILSLSPAIMIPTLSGLRPITTPLNKTNRKRTWRRDYISTAMISLYDRVSSTHETNIKAADERVRKLSGS